MWKVCQEDMRSAPWIVKHKLWFSLFCRTILKIADFSRGCRAWRQWVPNFVCILGLSWLHQNLVGGVLKIRLLGLTSDTPEGPVTLAFWKALEAILMMSKLETYQHKDQEHQLCAIHSFTPQIDTGHLLLARHIPGTRKPAVDQKEV